MATRYGTANYESEQAAINAYGKEGVKLALDEGRIAIGKPETKKGEKLLIDSKRRYWIEEGE